MKKVAWFLVLVLSACRHMPSAEELQDFSVYIDQQEKAFLLRSVQMADSIHVLQTKVLTWDSMVNALRSDPAMQKSLTDSMASRADMGRALVKQWESIRQTWAASLAEGGDFLDMCHTGADLRRIELQIPDKVRSEISQADQASLALLDAIHRFPYPKLPVRKPVNPWNPQPLPVPVISDTLHP